MAPAITLRRSVRINGASSLSKKLEDQEHVVVAKIAAAVHNDADRSGDADDEVAIINSKSSKKRKSSAFNRENSKSALAPRKHVKSMKQIVKETSTEKSESIRSKTTKKSKKKGTTQNEEGVEKRLRRFRAQPPSSYNDIAARALSQRFCVLERQRTGTEAEPEETIEIAGTTGNIYTVRINKVPSCDCPHAEKGNQCKHIIYVMKRTLRAPENLVYQLALLSSEVAQIFANAPPIPTDKGEADAKAAQNEEDPNRKPISEDCPICCDDFDPESEDIVWCKAACGNNVHRSCFETWARMKKAQRAKVTCPFCRTEWHDDKLTKTVTGANAAIGPDGYRNVAAQLGLSGRRDYSTYHQFWVRRQRRLAGGFIHDEEMEYYDSD